MRRIKYISDLYMKIYLNTKNLIILIATLFVLAVVSYYNLSLGFDKAEFVFIKDDYIANYLESTSNFLMIFSFRPYYILQTSHFFYFPYFLILSF